MKKILMVVGWEVQQVRKDDKSKYPADLILPNRRYWLFKYWPEDKLKVEVMSYKNIPLLSTFERRFLRFHLFQSLRVLRRMRKYDLIIFFHSQIGIIPALFKSILKFKTPLVLIDIEGLGRKNERFISPFIRKALSGINQLFYLASIQKEDYQKYFPEMIEKSHFLPFGLDLSRYSTNGKEKGDYIVSIGYQGADFRDWKTLIKAYSLLKTQTRLLIVGREKLKTREIGEIKIPPGVEFIKKTDLLTLNDIISKSKFVVLPLPERRHAFAQMTLLGCMALGKGVIVSRVSSVTDYLKDQEDGILVEPYNPEDLAEKMKNFLEDPDLRERLGQSAKTKVTRNFTEDKMAQIIYQKLKSAHFT